MKLSDMSNVDLAYVEGFIGKCAAHNVDPELFLESLMGKSAQVEVQKPMPGGSDTGPAQQPNTSTYVPSNSNVGRKVKGMMLPKLGQAADEEAKPDYEKRRRMTNVAMGAIPGGAAGGLLGAIGGSTASKQHPNLGAAIGGVAGAAGGAALGGGAMMIYNAIRNALGFSAMGAPIKAQTNSGL